MALNVSTGTPGDPAPGPGAFPPDTKFYDRAFVRKADPVLLYDRFGMAQSVPRNKSNTS